MAANRQVARPDRVSRLLGAWHAESPGAYRMAGLFALVATLLLGCLVWITGPVHQAHSARDTFYLLSAGWQLRNGLIPHTDFLQVHNLHAALTALAMWVVHDDVRALPLVTLLVAAVCGLWGWILASRRLSAPGTLLFVGVVILATLDVTHQGAAYFKMVSYSTQYNKFGWALLSLLILQVTIPPRSGVSSSGRLANSVSMGILLALLMLNKVSMFLAGLGFLLVVPWLLRDDRKPNLHFITLAFVLSWGVIRLVTGIRLDHFLLDVRAMSQAGFVDATTGVFGNTLADFFKLLTINLDWLVILLLVAMGGVGFRNHGLKLLWIALLMAGVGCFVEAFNYQGMTAKLGALDMYGRYVPSFAIGVLLIDEMHRRTFLALSDRNRVPHALHQLLSVALGIYFVVRIFVIPEVLGIVYASYWHTKNFRMHAENNEYIQSPAFQAMPLPRSEDEPDSPAEIKREVMFNIANKGTEKAKGHSVYLTPYKNAVFVNDALQLLRKHVDAKARRIWSLTLDNPFPFALRLPPPRQVGFWVPFNTGAALGRGPLAGRGQYQLLGEGLVDVDLLLEPKITAAYPESKRIRTIYAAEMAARFEKIDESELWILQRNRGIENILIK
ncbi:MAG: hypothetical protein HQL64_17015 [Magnetococcales bacterium]|nr:hypothetical protein [Magnetococcales bacterium]